MPKGELLKKLFHYYAQRDDHAFQEIAGEIIRDEESKNNRVLANALRRNLAARSLPLNVPENTQPGDARSPARKLNVVPLEREKQLPLIETIYPERRASDLILDRKNQRVFNSLLNEFRHKDTLGAHGLRPRSARENLRPKPSSPVTLLWQLPQTAARFAGLLLLGSPSMW
jgi:hypothetical protein